MPRLKLMVDGGNVIRKMDPHPDDRVGKHLELFEQRLVSDLSSLSARGLAEDDPVQFGN